MCPIRPFAYGGDMDAPASGRRAAGALRFLAELQAVAAECAATGVWDDEFSTRRRQREEHRNLEIRSEERVVKAL